MKHAEITKELENQPGGFNNNKNNFDIAIIGR
jgi:hypothetical protein